jgi:prolyl 4-hydroxylase
MKTLLDFYQPNDFIWICDEVLSAQDCDLIIEEAVPELSEAGIVTKSDIGYDETRNALHGGVYKERHEPQEEIYSLLERIEDLVSDLTGLPVKNQEPLNVVNYPEGGYYDEHYDAFSSELSESYERQMKRGGQRLFTMMFYLNDSFSGGQTSFPELDDFRIDPCVGRAVLWKNMEDGKVRKESKHSGMSVMDDEKWLAVKWVREQEYQFTKSEPR